MTAPMYLMPEEDDELEQIEDESVQPWSSSTPNDVEAIEMQEVSLLDEVGVPERGRVGGEDNEDLKLAFEACYTADFPLLKENPEDSDWVSWAKALWGKHSASVWRHLHMIERNRRMRAGDQWLSCIGYGPWVEPPKPEGLTRHVENVIRPALDQRIEIISEQRPGFRASPEGSSSQARAKKAEALQQLFEYQYNQQNMKAITRDASFWSGTDGVAFLHTYYDTNRGQWSEVVVDDEGTTENMPLGDFVTEVLRCEHVRVSADATATTKPKYWVIRRLIAKSTAVKRYGVEAAKSIYNASSYSASDVAPSVRSSVLYPDYDELLEGQDVVEEIRVYCDKTEYLKAGLCILIVGDTLIADPMPLPWGVVPCVRWTDGSTDPAFYPVPIMADWVSLQQGMNGLKSRMIDSIRVNSGGKLLVRKDAFSGETMTAGALTIWEFQGQGELSQQVMALPSFSSGPDLKVALDMMELRFGQLSYWNDTTRGNYSGDPSGRAILAQRETVERGFTPPVVAACEAMVEWAKINHAGAKVEYVTERMIAVEGEDRPDLTRAITEEDLNGVSEITIDPETMIPLPRAMRLYLLDDYLAKGIITPQEWRRRHPLAFVKNMHTPDNDHFSRAQRVNEAIRATGNPMALPILWQDDEAIHQDALTRELILPDDIDPAIRSAAHERWMMLGNQASMKAMTMPMPGGAPPQQGGGKPGGGMDPKSQPFQGTSPAIAASTASRIGGGSDQHAAAAEFEKRQVA